VNSSPLPIGDHGLEGFEHRAFWLPEHGGEEPVDLFDRGPVEDPWILPEEVVFVEPLGPFKILPEYLAKALVPQHHRRVEGRKDLATGHVGPARGLGAWRQQSHLDSPAPGLGELPCRPGDQELGGHGTKRHDEGVILGLVVKPGGAAADRVEDRILALTSSALVLRPELSQVEPQVLRGLACQDVVGIDLVPKPSDRLDPPFPFPARGPDQGLLEGTLVLSRLLANEQLVAAVLGRRDRASCPFEE